VPPRTAFDDLFISAYVRSDRMNLPALDGHLVKGLLISPM